MKDDRFGIKLKLPVDLTISSKKIFANWLGSLWLFFKSPKASAARKNSRYAFAGISLTILPTSVYHLPMNLDFMAMKYDAATVTGKLWGWVIFHWVRVDVALASGVFAILSFQNQTK